MKRKIALFLALVMLAAVSVIALPVAAEELNKDYILPKAFDKRVGPTVAAAVAEAARRSGVARL